MKPPGRSVNGNGSNGTHRHGKPAAGRVRSGREGTLGANLGLVQWFRLNDRDQVERVVQDLKRLGIGRLRTGLSWADYHRPGGVDWYDWLLPRLAREVEVLPCVMYTPPSLGVEASTAAPPRRTKDYADFLDVAITRWGACFEAVELWNEPTNPNHWDRRLDPDWNLFSEMVGMAAHWARERHKTTVLGGVFPSDFEWLRLMGERGVLGHIDVVGIHALPGTWEQDPRNWPAQLSVLSEQLRPFGDSRIWITEAGYSTWQQDEHRQALEFLRLAEAPVERLYWYSAEDLHPDASYEDGWEQDERHYHYGLKKVDGTPKLLYRTLAAGGMAAVKEFAELARRNGNGRPLANGTARLHRAAAASGRRAMARKPVLITGGAGFVGTNLAARLLDAGREVIVYDNLSRPGVEENLDWLLETYGERVHVEINDVRDAHVLRRVVERASAVFHLAAQVAVTTSLVDPTADFTVNAGGTLNVLEACRHCEVPPPVLFTSTNKVYGNLDDVPLRRNGERYEPVEAHIRDRGVGEDRPLDFHSPYGCSKGVADQYMLDYARCYGIPTVVFRMSCIYGPHQCGNEDQGWVAHFARRVLERAPITLYGDGCQVRDVLFVEDLAEAMVAAHDHIDTIAGRAFNIGGGPGNAVSLHQVLEILGELHGRRPKVDFGDWRQGDQRYYVSNTGAFRAATGWQPQVPARDGIERLYRWLVENLPARELVVA